MRLNLSWTLSLSPGFLREMFTSLFLFGLFFFDLPLVDAVFFVDWRTSLSGVFLLRLFFFSFRHQRTALRGPRVFLLFRFSQGNPAEFKGMSFGSFGVPFFVEKAFLLASAQADSFRALPFAMRFSAFLFSTCSDSAVTSPVQSCFLFWVLTTGEPPGPGRDFSMPKEISVATRCRRMTGGRDSGLVI